MNQATATQALTLVEAQLEGGIVLRYPAFPADCTFVEVVRDGAVAGCLTAEAWAQWPRDTAAAFGQLIATGEQRLNSFDGKSSWEQYTNSYPDLGNVLCVAKDGDFIRIMRNDRECCYWDCAEWGEDAELVLGAILGGLVSIEEPAEEG